MNATTEMEIPHIAAAPDRRPVEGSARRPSVLRLAVLAVLIVGVFAALAVAGMRARGKLQSDRDATVSGRSDRPLVLITKAEQGPAKVEQLLPGSASAFLETAVYARTSGYLKQRLVDIGDRVKEGQLLAEIETPEVDGQLLQARATLKQSQATLIRNKASETLARLNLARIRRSVEGGVGSQQDLDDADAALKVAEATVQVADATIAANAANVKRLEDLQGFQKVVAPFSGVVTAKNYDPGALIVADNATTRELFHLTQIDTIRVFADVPQTFATAVRLGQTAPVFRREAPGREFRGEISRTTNAVDPKTRTLRVEVDVPNPDGALLPGMYLQVRFHLDSSAGVRVPGAAIITRAEGTKIALLNSQNAIHYQPVRIGRDYGSHVEVIQGLSGGETVVLRPGDDLPEGTVVEPVLAGSR